MRCGRTACSSRPTGNAGCCCGRRATSPTAPDGRIEIVNEAGERIGREGDQVRLGGGETRPVEVGGTAEAEQWASELTGLDIPERCGDLYWIVSPF